MDDKEASVILEETLDVLAEVGNGVTNEMLYKQCDKLLKFRDEWFKKVIKKLNK